MDKKYKVAVYLRLSREDGDVADGGKAESNSISNQKSLILDYMAARTELELVDVYTDDGYTGTNFERPDFQRMMEDIRSGRVNCVIVKDLSRLGRNYIETGRYVEKLFPAIGVRFIAIMDNIDSYKQEYGSDLSIPFKNLLNDSYARDISIKVRSHMAVKRRNGEYIGAVPVYGYRRDEEDRNHLVPDPYAADVVRDIFQMKLGGMNPKAIAEKMNADGILAPEAYKKSCGIAHATPFSRKGKSGWSYITVLRILKNEMYIGTLVQGRVSTPNYKVKKRVYKAEQEWVRVENAHEAVVSREDFEIVQELLARDTRTAPETGNNYPLSGLLYCAECGELMVRKSVTRGRKKYSYYVCGAHKRDKRRCGSHLVSEEKLSEMMLDLINTYMEEILTLDSAVQLMGEAPARQAAAEKLEGRIGALNEERDKIRRRMRNLYEDYCDQILTAEEYRMMKEDYEQELKDIEAALERMTDEREAIMGGCCAQRNWIERIREFGRVEVLDRRILTYLIRKIRVENAESVIVEYRFEEGRKMLEAAAEWKEAV